MEIHTYHYDQVGSTIALTNDTGNVIGRAEYTAYGLIGRQTGVMNTPFLYNGRFGVMSDPNGLLYMRARYYSPFLMRFLNPDPIGFSGGMNWFAYADGNPISMLDPFGLSPKSNVDMGRYGALGGYGTGNGAIPFPKWDDYSTSVHLTLDGLGLIPGAGEAADGINGLIYLAEGNKTDAAFSLGAMIPIAGWGATGAKAYRHGSKVAEGGRTIANTIPKGIAEIKNAKGEIFKSVHTPPSAPHAGMEFHTHPNYRNVLPDGTIRSGVSKSANEISRRDIIDAARPGGQRTGPQQ